MSVNVTSTIDIDRPRDEVAAFAANPDNVPAWYQNIKSVEWETEPPLRVGTRVAFLAEFLGRRLAYTYVVAEHLPGERLVMRTSQGPFPMETRYEWRSTVTGGTRMLLTNRGEPRGFSRWIAPFITVAMRRANRKDLRLLKGILERG
ncbi:MAG: SRPBCC family protein [Candidatus Hydrogenedentales bacterium]